MRLPDPSGSASSPVRRFFSAPSPLPLTTWLERHQRASLALTVWITVVVGWSAASGHTGVQLLAHVIVPLIAAYVATRSRLPSFIRELGIILGLFTGAALVADLADGSVIAPVGYYLALALAALYERRADLTAGLVLTFAHQAIAGTVIPSGARVEGLPDWGTTALFALSFLILGAVLKLPWNANRTERLGRARETSRMLDHLAISEIVVELDTRGRVVQVSDHGLGVLALQRDDVIGRDWVQLVVEPHLQELAAEALARMIDPTSGPLAMAPRYFQFEHAILNGVGERRVFRWRTTVRTETGQILGTVTSGVDITEVRQAERQLLREQRDLARLALLAKAVAREPDARGFVVEGILDLADANLAALCEPSDSGDELVVTRSTRTNLIGTRIPLSGTASGTVLAYASGEPVFVADAAESPIVNQGLRKLSGGASFLFQPVVLDGNVAAVLTVSWEERVAELGTRHTNLVALAADEAAAALQRLAAQRRWEEAALTDDLTGVPNRRAFERMFDEALRHATEDHHPLAVALMDLNGFKLLNDSEGHAAGDRVLKESAALWAGELRPTDVLARLGGDEFAVLLPSCGVGHSHAVASRLRNALRHEAGCGVGIAVWNRTESAADLLHRADQALYADKARGAQQRLSERERLAAVEATGLLDEPADPELNEVTRLVMELVGVPMSTITLITPDRQFFASEVGMPLPTGARETSLDYSYCQHPATTGRELVVSDTREHELLRDNLSTTENGFVAYAGIPLSSGDQTVGVLCAIDTVPRAWTVTELDTLRNLAHRAQAQIDARAASAAEVVRAH